MAEESQLRICQTMKCDLELKNRLTSLFKTLKTEALVNMEHFQDGKHSHHARFHVGFSLLYEHLEVKLGIEPLATQLVQCVGEYDFSESVPANGYRSILKIIEKCCIRLVQLTRHITVNRDSLFFRSSHYCKELESFVSTLGQLRVCLYYVLKLISFCKPGELFAMDEELNEPQAEELMMEVETLNQDCFYGRCLGFQFCQSMQRPLQVVSLAMASFGDGYQEASGIMQFASSLFNSGKYILDPDLRGKQVVHMTRTADINFCKSFWGITETDVMQQLPSLVCPSVQVNEVITLHPETFSLMSSDGEEEINILPPCAHIGLGPVNIRLISHEVREGQYPGDKYGFKKLKKKILPPSSSIVIHCHGGGFVAQSSKSHEVYLRQWACELKVPIVSIDYSLAPEHPFPRALEECFYAYAWILNNFSRLGSTGETICLAGDSAGANLMISTSLKAVAMGVRVADGIMAAYTPTLVQYTPSPSRLLSLMDPLLPVGILSRCLAAYAGSTDDANPSPAHSTDKKPTQVLEKQLSTDEEWVYIEECPSGKPKAKDEKTVSPCGHSSKDPSLPSNNQIAENSVPKETPVPKNVLVCEPFPSEPITTVVQADVNNEVCIQSEVPVTFGLPNQQNEDLEPDYVLEEAETSSPPKSLETDSPRLTPDSGVHCDVTDYIKHKGLLSGQRDLSLDFTNFSQGSPQKQSCYNGFCLPRTESAPNLGLQIPAKCPMPGTLASPIYVPNDGTQDKLNEIRKLNIAKNPYMSPLLAPDELILGLPPIYFVACHLDPILDDSVMFAKRLRNLGKFVHLHVIDDLPHGFLNFALVNREAKQASDICVAFIDAVINLQE